MTIQLKSIASIFSGVTFRSKIETSSLGNVRLIQMKDLGDDNQVHLDQAIRINHSKSKVGQVQYGDLIFRSRGQIHTAALLNEKVDNAIVAAPLFCIRPNIHKVIPEYLLWWINQASSQSYLTSQARGTAVQMVGKKSLEDLEVNLPHLTAQRRIAEFFRLSQTEQHLLSEMKRLKALYTQGILMQMASQATTRRKK